jgi:hypothetical protein
VSRTVSSRIASGAAARIGCSCRPSIMIPPATLTTGLKSPTNRRADARPRCGASHPQRRPSGSSRSTMSFATCSRSDGIAFVRAISGSSGRARP